jgi:hypothetical protein
MAKDYLTGAGTWGTAALWQPSGVIPGLTDHAIIPGFNELNNNVTDAGGDANVDLAGLVVHREFVKSVGAAGAPIKTAAGIVSLYSAGPVYLECHSGGAAQNMDKIICALANSSTVCQLGSVTGNAGEVIKVKALRGQITIKNNINWAATSELYVGQVGDRADTNLTLASGGETLPLLRQESGVTHVKSVVTLGYVSGGMCTVSEAHVVTLHIGPGGQVYWKDETVDADNVSIHVYGGGLIDLLASGVPKEIDNLYLYPGASPLCRFDSEIITFTGADGLKDYRNAA